MKQKSNITYQIEEIEKIRKQINLEFDDLIKTITKDYKKCYYCNDYYLWKNWESGYNKENKAFLKCPNGHIYIDYYS